VRSRCYAVQGEVELMGFETERTEGGVEGESRIKFSVPITYKKHINEVLSRCFQDRYRQKF